MTADKLRIVACIDGSRAAPAVCDFAAWASRHMDTPLMLLHVLDEERYPAEPDLAGSIGLGSREHLLDELRSWTVSAPSLPWSMATTCWTKQRPG